MRLFSPLTFRFAEAIGMAAAGAAGGAGAHRLYSESWNRATPPTQAKEVDPFLKGSLLGDEQIEMAKYLWNRDMQKELIDYGDRDAWIKKAQEKSLLSAKWPGDIIFIPDKSDASLAKLLRDKCYSVSRWFLSKQDLTLDDNNPPLKEKFKNAKDSFTLDNLKDLCSTGSEDNKQYSITSAYTRSLRTLLQQDPKYTCDDSKEPESGWMKEIYDLKKGSRTGDSSKACNIVQDNIIVEITYGKGPKKYEIRKSQKKDGETGGYISVPRDDWTFYSSLEDLPGFSEMFKKNSR